MRAFAWTLAVLACLASAGPALAATRGEISFGLEGGGGYPTGDFGKAFKSGFSGGAFGDCAITEVVAIGIDASWQQFKEKDVPFDVVTVGTVTDWKAEVLQLGAHVKLAAPFQGVPVLPYAQIGIGLYDLKNKISSDVPELASDESKSKLGFNAGIGADYAVTPVLGVGVFGAWHSITSAIENVESSDKKAADYFTLGLKVTISAAATRTRTR